MKNMYFNSNIKIIKCKIRYLIFKISNRVFILFYYNIFFLLFFFEKKKKKENKKRAF
jgi:hypothetical protein